MSFRDDGEALRNRVDALEDELARAKQDAERMRQERDEARLRAVPATPPYGNGASVWIEWRGTWWRGTIRHVVGNDRYAVHYTGWSARWDETVSSARLAPGERPAPGRVGGGGLSIAAMVVLAGVVATGLALALMFGGPSSSAPPASSRAIASVGELHVGESVWVESSGTWYPANVLTISPDTQTARIHYQSYADTYDEEVAVTRIREIE